MEERELLLERLELALDRIREIPGEDWQEESRSTGKNILQR